MTSKDYIKLAEMLKQLRRDWEGLPCDDPLDVIEDVETSLIGALKADNPRFDEGRFKAAATIYDTKGNLLP